LDFSEEKNLYLKIRAVNVGRTCHLYRMGLLAKGVGDLYPRPEYPLFDHSEKLDRGIVWNQFSPFGVYSSLNDERASVVARLRALGYQMGDTVSIKAYVRTTEGHRFLSDNSVKILMKPTWGEAKKETEGGNAPV
jgi:hypothetical protein